LIPESFIQDLLARIAVEDVVGRYVQLRKGGANLLGLCPFHKEKTPSFTVSPSKQFYHCFGCGAHGNAISFLIEHTGASFPEAVHTLAAEVGLTVPQRSQTPAQREASQRRKTRQTHFEALLQKAHDFYRQQLRQHPPAIEYLKQRGLSGQVAARFQLGWSGNGRQALAQVMSDYGDPALVEAGLVVEAQDGRRYDRFRERITFPIFSHRGQLIGFGGRLIRAGEPKYLNSPDTPLFSKGDELYGLWQARQGLRQEGCVLVVEGYMDVVALAQHGMNNAVATLGTATTQEHLRKLMRASDRIIFCFDADNAGRQAAWRALTTSLPMLRDDVALRFLFLPQGHDPDSYCQDEGIDAFREQLQSAQALSAYMLEELARRHPLEEAEGRAACVHEAAPLLVALPDTVIKTQLLQEFATLVRLTPEELNARLASVAQPVRPGPTSVHTGGQHQESPPPQKMSPHRGRVPTARQARGVTPMAKRLLRLLLAYPEVVESVGDQQLEILMVSPHLELVRDLIILANTCGARHTGALLEALDPESDLAPVLTALATELLTQEELPDPYAEWKDALTRIELNAIKAEQSALIQAGLRDETSKQRYQQLTRQLAQLDPANRRVSS